MKESPSNTQFHTWCLSRKTLAPEGLAPEEHVHVAPEGVAELLRVLVLMLEHGVIMRVSGALEGRGLGQ